MTMRAVCREAGLSQKFFYESFASLDELLLAVYRKTLERVELPIGGGRSDLLSPSDVERAAVDRAAQLLQDDPRICRVLLVEPIADTRLRHLVRDSITTLLDVDLPELGEEELIEVKMAYSTLLGALISLFLEWSEGNLGSDRDVFVDHVMAVLRARPGLASAHPFLSTTQDQEGHHV